MSEIEETDGRTFADLAPALAAAKEPGDSGDYELVTPITITYADGTTRGADLCVWRNEPGEQLGEIAVTLCFKNAEGEYIMGEETGIECSLAAPDGAWTLEELTERLGFNPQAPIWHVDEIG